MLQKPSLHTMKEWSNECVSVTNAGRGATHRGVGEEMKELLSNGCCRRKAFGGEGGEEGKGAH